MLKGNFYYIVEFEKVCLYIVIVGLIEVSWYLKSKSELENDLYLLFYWRGNGKNYLFFYIRISVRDFISIFFLGINIGFVLIV